MNGPDNSDGWRGGKGRVRKVPRVDEMLNVTNGAERQEACCCFISTRVVDLVLGLPFTKSSSSSGGRTLGVGNRFVIRWQEQFYFYFPGVRILLLS